MRKNQRVFTWSLAALVLPLDVFVNASIIELCRFVLVVLLLPYICPHKQIRVLVRIGHHSQRFWTFLDQILVEKWSRVKPYWLYEFGFAFNTVGI